MESDRSLITGKFAGIDFAAVDVSEVYKALFTKYLKECDGLLEGGVIASAPSVLALYDVYSKNGLAVHEMAARSSNSSNAALVRALGELTQFLFVLGQTSGKLVAAVNSRAA